MAIFVSDYIQLLFQLAPAPRPLPLKMIYKTKRDWDQRTYSFNVRPRLPIDCISLRIGLKT